MTRALIRCDGAPVPARVRARDWDVQEDIRHQGTRANLNLRIESPSHALLTSVADRAADLVRIASYIYAADQLVRRGGDADAYGDHWQRHFTVCLPVSDPAFWSSDGVSGRLQEVLQFASEDFWSFEFAQGVPDAQQLPFDVEPQTALGDPDAVILFSGGVDSLCAVVEAATEGSRKPLLVGHSPAFNIAGRQRQLAKALKGRFGQIWHFPYQSFAIHRMGSDPREYTQRTRSFLYATLGAVIAERLGLSEAALPDNGTVSLNLPTNAQLIGTKASRTTHPKFLRLFNNFVREVWPEGPMVINPLWSKTRAEGLAILKRAKVPELLEETNSCSHQRNLTAMRPHCGTCSQCVDRRFSTLAAGLEEYDPAERYEVDIFRGAISEGDARTMAISYVRFAIEVSEMSDDGLFARFPELHDAIDPNDTEQRATAEALTALLRRYGAMVQGVAESQVGRWRREFVRQELPPTCLIRLLATPTEPVTTARFRPNPDYREVWLDDVRFPLTPNQARVVEFMHSTGDAALSQAYILEELEIKSGSLYQVFRGSSAWGRVIVRANGQGMYRLNL